MWKDYIERTKDKAHSKLLESAISIIDRRGKALDLGSGNGNDVRYLVSQGIYVVAVDAEEYAGEQIQDLVGDSRAEFIHQRIEDFVFHNYSLINASYALPFVSDSKFRGVWQRIYESLDEGGLFVGQLFGTEDSWNRKDGKMNFHSREGVEELLEGWEVVELQEEKRQGRTAAGSVKNWHVFHMILRKKTNV